MTTRRIVRFAVVGAAGLAVQIAALWLLHERIGFHYEPASILATELAILHNFVWHVRWTWSDRAATVEETARRLLRFHLSSGAVSIVGAVLLMPALVDGARLNVLAADVVVVVACSFANFVAIDRAVFTRFSSPESSSDRRVRHCAIVVLGALALSGPATTLDAADLLPSAGAVFDGYARRVEERLDREMQGGSPFLLLDRLPAPDQQEAYASLGRGSIFVTHIQCRDSSHPLDVPGGLCHHWFGTVFIRDVTMAQVSALMQSYDRYAQVYSPAVRRSTVNMHEGNRFKVSLQVFMKKVVSVVLNTDYDVQYLPVSPARMQVRSVSTRIAEVDPPESTDAHERPVGHDSGFLWRLNNYCALEERPLRAGAPGTFVQCESVSLSRAVPLGLDWLIGPSVSSVPRESLEFTLNAMRTALTSGPYSANAATSGR